MGRHAISPTTPCLVPTAALRTALQIDHPARLHALVATARPFAFTQHRHDKRLVRDAAFINFLATALGTANHMVQIVTGIGMAVQSVAVAVLVLSGLPTAAKIFGVIGASCGAGLVLGTTLCCCLSLLRIISKRQQVRSCRRNTCIPGIFFRGVLSTS